MINNILFFMMKCFLLESGKTIIVFLKNEYFLEAEIK